MKRVKQVLTRFATMFLALICVIGMGTPVFADNVIDTDGHTFKISGLENREGIQVNAYQIISVNLGINNQAANPLYIWDGNVADWMTNGTNNASYGKYVNTVDAGEATEEDYVSEQFKVQLNGQTGGVPQKDATMFYEELAAEIRKSTVSIGDDKTYSKDNGDIRNGAVTFDNQQNGMPLGVYLVTVTGGIKTYQPTVVTLLPKYENNKWTVAPVVGVDKTTNVKSANPAITKKVIENQTVAVGETVKYQLEITAPDYPINSTNKTIVIDDTFDPGINFVDESIKVYGNKIADENIIVATNKEVDPNVVNYTIEKTGSGNIYTAFKITFKEGYSHNYQKLFITYEGRVTSTAFSENPDKLNNVAEMTYSTDPYATPDVTNTVDSSARVYSYRIQINKFDKQGGRLDGAKFQIFTKDGDNVSKKPLNFTGDKGNYILASSTETTTTTTTTDLQVSDLPKEGETTIGGTLLIKGLDVGTYVIKEVVAPDHYVLPDGQLEVTITDEDLDGSIDDPVTFTKTGSFELYTGHEVVPDGEAADGIYVTNTGAAKDIPNTTFNNTVTIDVLNTSSKDANFTLPSTGGMGTLIFTVGGLFVMAGAVVLAVVMYKKKNA